MIVANSTIFKEDDAAAYPVTVSEGKISRAGKPAKIYHWQGFAFSRPTSKRNKDEKASGFRVEAKIVV